MKLILGVPGSGKTTYLAKELSNYKATEYVFTSLTNASIRAFLTKIGESSKIFSIRTLYGLSYKALEKNGLLDEWKKEKLKNYQQYLNEVFAEFNLPHIYKDDIENILSLLTLEAIEKQIEIQQAFEIIENEIQKIVSNIKLLQKILNLINEILDAYYRKEFYAYPFLLYEALSNNLDIFKVFTSSTELEPMFIVFDEFQDVPLVIYKYLNKFGKLKKCWIVGDPAQEIFTFLKTNSKYLVSRASKVEYLTKTHRFGEEISNLANKILKKLGYSFKIKPADRQSKVFELKYSFGNLVSVLNILLKRFKEVSILVRTKDQVYDLEEKLIARGFNVVNLEKFDYAKLKQALNKLEQYKQKRKTLLDFTMSDEELVRLVSPSEQIKKILEKMLYEKIVYVATVHSVKGLEFENVVFIDTIPRKISKLLEFGELDEKDELKVVYVAITRAKYNLVILRDVNGYFSYFGF